MCLSLVVFTAPVVVPQHFKWMGSRGFPHSRACLLTPLLPESLSDFMDIGWMWSSEDLSISHSLFFF